MAVAAIFISLGFLVALLLLLARGVRWVWVLLLLGDVAGGYAAVASGELGLSFLAAFRAVVLLSSPVRAFVWPGTE